jgi:cytidine deaminase
MNKINIESSIESYDSFAQLPAEVQLKFQRLFSRLDEAYAPYSGFRVACLIELENGQEVLGTNQENASFPAGLCAERVALSAASSLYPGVAIRAMFISYQSSRQKSDKPVAPCGVCRQAILEYENRQSGPVTIWLSGLEGRVFCIHGIKPLLPLSFSSSDL